MGISAGAVGLAGGIAGLLGGTPASNVNVPTPYQYQNQGGADQNAYAGIGGLNSYNTYGQYLPQAQGLAQGIVNNPYQGQYQQGADVSGGLQQGAGFQSYGAGGALNQAAGGTLPDIQALMTMGFDPQNALYSKLQQQNTDQTNAQNSMSGVASTPYGAGLADQSNQNFNLAWQNNELQRASTAAQGAGSLLGQAGGAFNTGTGLQSAGAQGVLAGAGTPYSTFNTINQTGLGALNQGGAFGQSASTLPQQSIQDYLAYLSGGTSAANAGTSAANAQLNQANLAFNQQQTLGRNIGSSLGQLGGNSTIQGGLGQAGNSSPFASAFAGLF